MEVQARACRRARDQGRQGRGQGEGPAAGGLRHGVEQLDARCQQLLRPCLTLDDGRRHGVGVDAGALRCRLVDDGAAQGDSTRPDQTRVVDRLKPREEGIAADQARAAGGDHAAPGCGLAVQGRGGNRQGHAGCQQVVARLEASRGQCRRDVGAQGPCQAHGSFDVELASALLDDAGVGQGLCRVLEDRLHQRGRQARIGLQQDGHGPSDRRSSDRRAAELHHRLLPGLRCAGHLRQLGVVAGQEVPARGLPGVVGGQSGDDAIARGDQIGLDEVVHPSVAAGKPEAAARGSARAEARHHVVTPAGRGAQVGGTDGDGGRFVPGRGDGAIDRLSRIVLAVVAGGRNDHEAGRSGAARGACQGIGEEGLVGSRAQAQVHDADVGRARALDHPVDARERVGHVAHAALVQHAQVVQVGRGCDAAAVGGLIAAGPGSHRGHMGTVAIGIRHIGRRCQLL